MKRDIPSLLADLTGERLPFAEGLEGIEVSLGPGPRALGYSQLNELLLLVGLDRVHETFFAYLLDGEIEYRQGSGFDDLERLAAGVDRFRTSALMLFGNVKFAFKTLSTDPDVLAGALATLEPVEEEHFSARHDPILPVDPIEPADAYLTGYMVQATIDERLQADPNDKEALALQARVESIVRKSIRNQEAYYASDHMDVYVATSMREKHEFVAIESLTKSIFDDAKLKGLKLRWFDPTQAYCADRIDKGLAEALMLKRASCTIYLAQASDTLGKDSELASTLAQGKPVIAYIPAVTESYFDEYMRTVADCDPDRPEAALLLDQLFVFSPRAAWDDDEVRRWAANADARPVEVMRERLFKAIRGLYDKRAKTLKESHPLGIQVNLQSGVANGVLVARTAEECARLVHGILTRTLVFDLEETPRHTLLRERVSGSIFRVMTKDAMLTNTFWNFYLG